MSSFFSNTQGMMEFTGGVEAWPPARDTALACNDFIPDEEDEQVCEEPRSCYNCRYRRWTATSFACMRGTTGQNSL